MKDKIKFSFIIVSACIASLGTYPYAQNFSQSIFSNQHLILIFGIIFVITGVPCNLALGAYSLHNTVDQIRSLSFHKVFLIFTICFFAALANGFITFIGYFEKLPISLTITVSIMVVIVNTGIGFSALNNLIGDLQESLIKFKKTKFQSKLKNIKKLKIVVIIFTGFASILVTLTAFLASTHELHSIFNLVHLTVNTSYQILIYIMALLIWFPGAMLFLNGSRITISKIYESVSKGQLNFSLISLFIFIVAILSGSAYAQMALEFFDSSKFIPNPFKIISSHTNLVFFLIMPLAFAISAIVNGYVLDRIFNILKK